MTNILITAALLALLTSGCTVAWSERRDSYSRAEIDAITAETACRNNARTMLQMERCIIRR